MLPAVFTTMTAPARVQPRRFVSTRNAVRPIAAILMANPGNVAETDAVEHVAIVLRISIVLTKGHVYLPSEVLGWNDGLASAMRE